MIFVPIGLFIYGWAAEGHVHWIVPMLGAAIFAFGMLIAYVCIQIFHRGSGSQSLQICVQTYLVDSFVDYSASALAAAIVLRSIFGAIFSIVGANLYQSLGYGWYFGFLRLLLIFSHLLQGNKCTGVYFDSSITHSGVILGIRSTDASTKICWMTDIC